MCLFFLEKHLPHASLCQTLWQVVTSHGSLCSKTLESGKGKQMRNGQMNQCIKSALFKDITFRAKFGEREGASDMKEGGRMFWVHCWSTAGRSWGGGEAGGLGPERRLRGGSRGALDDHRAPSCGSGRESGFCSQCSGKAWRVSWSKLLCEEWVITVETEFLESFCKHLICKCDTGSLD